MTAFVVVNPRSGNGRTGRDWKRDRAQLGRRLSAHVRRLHAARGARRRSWCAMRLREGHHEIVAVGGDGTINEAVNGFFDANGPVSPDAVFGFVTSGTGGDFRKTFGIEAGRGRRHRASEDSAAVRAIDVGRAVLPHAATASR